MPDSVLVIIILTSQGPSSLIEAEHWNLNIEYPDVWTFRKAELQGSPRKSKQKNSVYKLYEVRNFWAVSERNTAQTAYSTGGCVGLQPGRQGRSTWNLKVETSTRHRLSHSLSLAAALWTLPASHLILHRNSFSWKAAQLAAVPGHLHNALRPKLRNGVSFPARDEKSQWRSPIGPNGVMSSPTKQSVWPAAYGSMTGYPAQGYAAPHVTSGSGFVIEKEGR